MGTHLRSERVGYTIGAKALLRDITIQLPPGAVYVLVGPNGAGKSTLLQLLAGTITPTSGDVFLDDKRLHDYSKKDLALKRAVMPQDVALSLAFTSEEVVMMGRYPHGEAKGGHDHSAIVQRTMVATESEPLRQRLYPTLSGGEQARVTMARVLAQETPLLFLDEPTASLDPRHQHLVMKLARQHSRQGGTVLAVLHDLNLAAAYADVVVVLSDGQLRAHGDPKEILQPDLLQEVFQTGFYVADHPGFVHPLVLSLPTSD